MVGTAWANVIFSPDSIDEKDLNDLIAELRQLNARAIPASAEGDLYAILDLLRHTRTRSGMSYLPMMRVMLKNSLQGDGNPSAGLVTYALGLVGGAANRSVVALCEGLKNSDWRVRVACVRALKEIELGRDDPAIIPALAGALADRDALVREIAVDSLRELGPRGCPASAALVTLIGQDSRERIRLLTVSAFHAMRCKDPSVLQALVGVVMNDADDTIRMKATEVLGELAPQSEEAIQALEAALGDPIDTVRATAAKALVRIGPPQRVSPSVLGYLKQEIARGDGTAWAMNFVEELPMLGPEARTVVPLLINELKTTDDLNVRARVASALGNIDPDDDRVYAALVDTTKDSSWFVRASVLQALARSKSHAPAVVTRLITALDDPDDQVRRTAAESLGKLGPAARAAVPKLRTIVERDNTWAKAAAEEALKTIDP